MAGTTDTYSYVGTSEVVARIATGAATLDSIVTSEGDRLAVRSGGTLNYLVPDPHGNVAGSLSADEATIVNAIRYDAYGETIATGTAGGSAVGAGAWTYQGRLDVSPAGLASPLLDMSARFYAPAIGAFTSLDSVTGSAQNPLSMNRYLYAHANPATLIDPTGHYAMEFEYGYTKSSPDPRHQQVSRRCQSKGDYGCGSTATNAKTKPRPAAAKPRVRPGHPGSVNRNGGSEARHRELARDLRIAVESAPINPFALEQDRGYQRLWSDAHGACMHDDEACRFFDALDGWERSNRAAFCSANGPYCQEVSNARGAEVWATAAAGAGSHRDARDPWSPRRGCRKRLGRRDHRRQASGGAECPERDNARNNARRDRPGTPRSRGRRSV